MEWFTDQVRALTIRLLFEKSLAHSFGETFLDITQKVMVIRRKFSVISDKLKMLSSSQRKVARKGRGRGTGRKQKGGKEHRVHFLRNEPMLCSSVLRSKPLWAHTSEISQNKHFLLKVVLPTDHLSNGMLA